MRAYKAAFVITPKLYQAQSTLLKFRYSKKVILSEFNAVKIISIRQEMNLLAQFCWDVLKENFASMRTALIALFADMFDFTA